MPPTAPDVPFALHAPSEYTTSTVVFLGAAILGGLTGPGAGEVAALDTGWGNGFGIVTGGGFNGMRVTSVLLELVKTTLGDDTAGAVGVAVVICGFAGCCGRLDLYQCSASGLVLNFLNFAPGNPLTYDSASSLYAHYSATVPKHLASLGRGRRSKSP